MGLIRAGETCWRQARATRLALLNDCEDYFAALRQALRAARRSIHLLGWGFDPRIKLTQDDPTADAVGRELAALAAANPALDVRLLVWRSALPISATQGFFPHRAKGWFKGTGVRFELDAATPLGASQHQKVVVIDDALAFVGGADLMADRWDTTQHLDHDSRRTDFPGHRHGCRHEVMAMVEGPVAAALGELFRARWGAAIGEAAPDPGPSEVSPWPDGWAADLADVDVAIARTQPAWRGAPAVREIAELTLESIFAARSLIYLENQYFTWPLAVEALAARLAEPQGPEVVLICSHQSPSYFDRITMDRARANALWRLKTSDVFGRFHALAPFTAGGAPIVAHSKVMIVDDALLRVSSANLNNRSHGFDSECGVAVEASTPAERAAIAGMRDRLAAHWVGRGADDLAAARTGRASYAGALFAMDEGAHRLRSIPRTRLGPVGEFIADFHIGDPVEAADSWRPWRRRADLIAEARALRMERLTSPR
ncbi:MAG TPA: phospholipase D-like domain-containing protein [Caulobacteraceae bacterium]|jgi:phosphatidylserine/phosphatidylglycerophosphate/cardiolipin synthase-like enzyme